MSEKANEPGQGAGTSAEAAGDGAGAGNELTLDQLLDEWDSSGKGGEPSKGGGEGAGKGGGQDGEDYASLKDRLDRTEQRLVEQDYRREMDRVIGTVREKVDANPDFVEWWVNKRADADQRLRELWQQRDSNSGEWEKAINALADDFAKEHGGQKPSQDGLDETSRAVQAAMASGSEASSGRQGNVAEELAKLSDTDFELKKGEVFRQQAQSA